MLSRQLRHSGIGASIFSVHQNPTLSLKCWHYFRFPVLPLAILWLISQRLSSRNFPWTTRMAQQHLSSQLCSRGTGRFLLRNWRTGKHNFHQICIAIEYLCTRSKYQGQAQVITNYIAPILWDVISCPCLWYLPLAHVLDWKTVVDMVP